MHKLSKGKTYLSELFSVSLSSRAFNFVSYFDTICVQCWDGRLIIQDPDNETIEASIPNFSLPGIMKVIGCNIIVSQGNRLLGFSIQKLLAGDEDNISVI